MAEIKRCSKCGIEKSPDAFYKNKSTNDGFSYWCKKCTKHYADGHRDHYKNYHETHKDAGKIKKKEWKANNIERVRIYRQRRRAKKRDLPYTLTIEQWEAITLHFNHRCAYCGKSEELTQDHFVAMSRNGEYTHNNIVPACKRCNFSKNDTSFFCWYPRQVFYSKKREAKILKFLHYQNGTQQLSLPYISSSERGLQYYVKGRYNLQA